MDIVQKFVRNFEQGRRGREIIGIVLHTMVGTLEGTYQWFNNLEAKASSHYGIGLDGRVWQFVKEEDTAWHVGNNYNPTWKLFDGTNANFYTIGIEHEDKGQPDAERTEKQYEASGKLVRDICHRWNIPINREHIIGHREIYARKSCPGTLDIDRVIQIAKRESMNGTQPTLDWAVKLESFFQERQIPPERRESKVREWADAQTILDGHIAKWIDRMNLVEGSGLSTIDEQIEKLLKNEDAYALLRSTAEKVVGKHYEDDKSLLEALSAVEGSIKILTDERDGYKTKVEEWHKKENQDLIYFLRIARLAIVIKIFKEGGEK